MFNFQQLKISKQDGGIEKVRQWDDITYITVPNVIGLSIKEASRLLYPTEVEVSGSGDKIVEQSPKAGEKIDINSKVRIFLG